MALPALTRVQFELSGGWRQNVAVQIAYVLLVVVIAGIAYRLAGPNGARDVDAVFLTIISIVQPVLLLMVAPSAVRRAVLRDFQTGMIESHRLTPQSGLSLVFGYVVGASAQALMLYALGWIVGAYFVVSCGLTWKMPLLATGAWYGSQLCLLPLALLIVALTLLTALTTRGRANLVPVLLVLGVVGGWILIWLVPGLALLMGALSAGMVIKLLGGAGPFTFQPAVMGWAMVLQTALGLTLLAAACRKVRAPHQPVFTLRLGMLLLFLAGMTLAIGWDYFRDFRPSFVNMSEAPWQWVGSVVVFLLVGLFPLATAATERVGADARSERATRVQRGALDAIPFVVTAMTLVLLSVVFPWRAVAGEITAARLMPLALVLGASCWADYQCLCWARTRHKNQFLVIMMAWAVLKVLPLLLQALQVLVYETMLPGQETRIWLAALSPIGTLIQFQHGGALWPGLIGQLICAVGVTLLAQRARASASKARP